MYNYSIFDTHCDTLCAIADFGGDILNNHYNVDKRRMLKYKSYTQVFACYISPRYENEAWERFFLLKNLYDRQDFSGIRPFLSVEGAYMIKSTEDVYILKACGVRCMALTWNGSNRLAGGADDEQRGITPLGRDVIRTMNKLNIILDVSHLNDKSFFDAAEISEKPIVATHSNARSMCAHRRNLTDEMFKIICDKDGCTGINLYPPFLNHSGKAEVSDVLKHIEHFLSLGGENHIGIGADFDGTDNDLPSGINGCEDLYKIFDSMSENGFSAAVTEKISHSNFERVFKEV